jgi:hypothetical protein
MGKLLAGFGSNNGNTKAQGMRALAQAERAYRFGMLEREKENPNY